MTKAVNKKDWNGGLYVQSDGSTTSYQPQQQATGIPFPRTAAITISGDANGNQHYLPSPYSSQVSGKVISSTGFFQESSYGNPIPWMGRYDICIIGGQWEGWDDANAYDRGVLTDCVRQITNVSGFNPTKVWQYHIFEERETNNGNAPYNSMYPTVDSQKWLLYGAANQSGSPVNDSFGGGYSTNWAVAWPGNVNGVSADNMISPGRTIATYNGSAEDLTQYAAAYFIELTLARHSNFSTIVDGTISASSYTDSRWYPTLVLGNNNDSMKAPNVDAIFLDNLFCVPQTGGYYDLANNYAAYDYTSATMPWLIRGAQHFQARVQEILAKCYPSRSYHRVGNIAQFPWAYQANPSQFSTRAGGLSGYLDGGVLESVVGPGSSFDRTYGTAATIQSYQTTMDFCSTDKLVVVHGEISSMTDYQTARYALAISLMDAGFCCTCISGYKANGQLWLDEFGGNPGTNIGKGWLNQPTGARPTSSAISGCWVRDFNHGTVILNPMGNGSKTITASQLNSYLGTNYSFKFFHGVQNPSLNSGASMSSVTLNATSTVGDAVLLMH